MQLLLEYWLKFHSFPICSSKNFHLKFFKMVVCASSHKIYIAFLSAEHSLACVRAGYHLDLLLFSLCQMLFMDGEFALIHVPTPLPSV